MGGEKKGVSFGLGVLCPCLVHVRGLGFLYLTMQHQRAIERLVNGLHC